MRPNSQATRIKDFFRFNPTERLTPPQVKTMVGLSCPLTSVRRALTVLTDRGVLKKTEDKGDGLFGQPNHRWVWHRTTKSKSDVLRLQSTSERI